MIAIIRIRGKAKMKKTINDTMVMLNLEAANNCIVIPKTDAYEGMIKKAKDYITFGEINKEVFKKMLLKWGRITAKEHVTEEYLKEHKYDADKLFDSIEAGKEKLQNIGILPTFRLHPPRKGFKSVKRPYSMKGDLGNREEKINELLERMI